MKQKRSLDEALDAAKALRKQVPPSTSDLESNSSSESHLKVVDKSGSQIANESDNELINPKPIWVRHTIGLHDTTSLDLRDAADQQKRKERRGQLRAGEPANEQEIADLGIRLALKQIGFLNEPMD